MKSILIIEDVAEIRRLVKLCTLRRYSVREVASGEEALLEAYAHPPDLIVLDIGLQGRMTGLDFLDALRQDVAFHEVRVLVLSGSETRERARLRGVDVVVAKPFRPLELADCIDRLLADEPSHQSTGTAP